MATVVIKTENQDAEEDIKPHIIEGGTLVGGGSASTTGVVGVKTIVVEKQQAALKVANEAKQLNLRLREQKQLLQQQPPPPSKTPTTTPLMGKRRNSATAMEEESDNTKSPRMPVKYGINKRYRLIAPKPTSTPPQQPTAKTLLGQPVSSLPTTKPSAGLPVSSSRCGEIFVTNNANKWTFVCTFCQKTTRDIGEFVCHIKFKHMGGHYYNDDEDDEDNNESIKQMQSNTMEETYNNSNEQDYFDCANYLDVNVHTDADDMAYNGVENPQQLKTQKPKTKDIKKSKTTQKEKYVVDLLDDEEEEKVNDNEENPDDTKFHTEVFDYDVDEDEDGVELVDDDNMEMMEGMEGEDDHLAFLRSNSIEDEFNGSGRADGGSGGKKYRSHVRGKAYCKLCDKTFQYYSLYRNHMIKHSNITPYKCQYCSKAFKSKQAIRYHMNTHTKEVQYKCPLCPITYGTENQFITHVLNHESEDCFPCMVCAKILTSDHEREEHLETHTEERPFGCEYCNKRFRQKHHLSNHLKLHCQYRCDFCKEEFVSTQTQRRPYACPTCEAYPDIRQQVEKQRSKTLNNSEVNPLELTYDNSIGQDMDGDCVDLAESDDESETGLLVGADGQKRVPCKYCKRAYKHNSALNYHMRMKHPHEWQLAK